MLKMGAWLRGLIFVNLTDVGDPVDAARAYYEAGCDDWCSWTLPQHMKKNVIQLWKW